MDWIKLSTDYPLAYKLMEKDFNCLYTLFGATPVGNEDAVKITHPLKRDLYEFFDTLEIYVEIWRVDEGFEFFVNDVYAKDATTRSQAETLGFVKAFKILNDQLTK
jgi:hypothetical protein